MGKQSPARTDAKLINMSKARVHKKPTSFLQKAYELVSDASNSFAVAWTSDGMGFFIKSVPDFTEHILPKYFKHNNFASFVRQLNMYDFHKSREDGSDNVFRHQFFLKGKKHLLREIHRKTSEQSGGEEGDSELSRADCQRLLARVQELQQQHEKLEITVRQLKGENQDMAAHNLDLLTELNTYKTREENLEGLLRTFSTQLMNVAEQDSYGRFGTEPCDEPLYLMEEDQPSEFAGPVKSESDCNYSNLKSEIDEALKQYFPEANTESRSCGDSEMDAEIEKMLEPKV